MITKIEIFPALLPLKSDFQIAGGVVANKNEGAPHVFVKITDDTNNFGWGECRPSRRWSYETLETVTTTLNNYLAPEITGMDEYNLSGIHQKITAHQNIIRCIYHFKISPSIATIINNTIIPTHH